MPIVEHGRGALTRHEGSTASLIAAIYGLLPLIQAVIDERRHELTVPRAPVPAPRALCYMA